MFKEELEAIIKSDNIWAGRSTLILAIGILGEYVVLPFLEKEDRSPAPWFTSRRHSKTSGGLSSIAAWIDLSSWKRPLKILFAVFVVAGVVGEYEFSSRIARNADTLQQLSDEDLTAATNMAGDAIEKSTASSRDNFKLGKDLENERQKTAGDSGNRTSIPYEPDSRR